MAARRGAGARGGGEAAGEGQAEASRECEGAGPQPAAARRPAAGCVCPAAIPRSLAAPPARRFSLRTALMLLAFERKGFKNSVQGEVCLSSCRQGGGHFKEGRGGCSGSGKPPALGGPDAQRPRKFQGRFVWVAQLGLQLSTSQHLTQGGGGCQAVTGRHPHC